MDYSPEQLEAAYNALPPDLRSAMDSVEISEKITEIGKKQALHIDQLEELANETSLVMLGLVSPAEYPSRLEKALAIPYEQAVAITAAINTEVMSAIRESLKKLHVNWEKTDLPAASEAAPAETIDRDALLKEIETSSPVVPPSPAPAPTAVPSFAVSVVSVPSSTPSPVAMNTPITPVTPVNLPVGAPALPIETPPPAPSGFAAVKLTGAAEAPPAKTVEKSESIAAIKKTDPYREPIG